MASFTDQIQNAFSCRETALKLHAVEANNKHILGWLFVEYHKLLLTWICSLFFLYSITLNMSTVKQVHGLHLHMK